MKKDYLLIIIFFVFSLNLFSQEPTLTRKYLHDAPAIPGFKFNRSVGTRSISTNNAFAPSGNFTLEIKAKLLSAATKGFFLESRLANRKGFRLAIHKDGIANYSTLNYTNSLSIISSGTEANNDGGFHVFRFAVEGNNVHIYRDGVFITTTSLQSIYNDNYMKDNNGDLELEDMSMWNFVASGQGRTTTAGEFQNGAAGVKLVNSDNSTVIASLTIKGLKPSTTYALSMYAKYLSKSANNGNMRFDLKLGGYDGTGTFIRTNASDAYNNVYGSPTNSSTPSSAVWTVNYKSFTTGITDSVAMLDFMGWNGNNTYAIDDIVLYEAEATPTIGSAVGSNLVVNGDFNADATGWSAGGWPLGAVAWSSTNGGQLQIKEASWVASSNGTYSQNIAVTPGKTYKLSAKTSQRLAAASPLFRSVKLADGASSVSADYSVPTGSLTTYYTNTTPALTAGPATTSLSMQFTTKTNSSTGTPVVVMTLDDVVLQEYEASFPAYLKYGKAYQSEALNCEVAYINYDLTGAYAPELPLNIPVTINTNSNISDLSGTDGKNLTVTGENTKLTVNVSKSINSLTVESSAIIDVVNPMTISGDLVLKAGKNSAPSIKVANSVTVSGNFRLETTIDNSKWYFVSFPCNVAVNEIAKLSGSGELNLGTNWWIKYYDGASRGQNGKGANWKEVLPGETIVANKGYIIGLANSLTGDYTLSIPLNKNLVSTAESLKNISVAANTGAASINNHGWNLIGQPYLSAFKGSNTSGAFNIYLFDGSTYVPYDQLNVPDITPFKGYFIQASNDLASSGINFALEGRQSVRSLQVVNEQARIELRLTNASGTDYALVKLDDTKTSAYEIGYDLEKWITIETDKPQLYTRIESQDLAFNVLPASEVNNLTLGYYTKNAGIQTLSSVINSNTDISELQLIDKTEGKTINLLNQNYTFDSEVGTINNRFSLQIRKVTTGTTFSSTDKGAFLYIKDKIMAINNLNTPTNVQVFDISGKLIVTTICSDTKNSITLPSKGVYTVRWFENGKIKNSKVVVL